MATRTKAPTFERVPPQNIEAERCVLGAMLLNPDAIDRAIDVLRHDLTVFYQDSHHRIYGAMLSLHENRKPIDAVTLMDELEKRECAEMVGGAGYIAELAESVPTSANVEYYAQIIVDAAILRRIIVTAANMASAAYSAPSDVPELLDGFEVAVLAINDDRSVCETVAVRDLMGPVVAGIERVINSKSSITGIPTGFHPLDEMLSGLHPGEMIVLAARTSVGKTALALNIAVHVALTKNRSVLYVNLEMSDKALAQRMLAMQAGIDMQQLRRGFVGRVALEGLAAASSTLSRINLSIDSTPRLFVGDLRSLCRRHKSRHGLDLVVIDYLQKLHVRGRHESRQVYVSEISRCISELARELGVPVLALSQENREAGRDGALPKLSDLRESGSIEHDADVVLMLQPLKMSDDEKYDFRQKVDLWIMKQRNGPTGCIHMLFDKRLQRFKLLDKSEDAEAEPAPKQEDWLHEEEL